jgi:hypothetical protein
MTNEQLAVLMHGYAERLRIAIERADELLGDDVDREEIEDWRYVGPAGIGHRVFSNTLTHPEDWEEIVTLGLALALVPLRELLGDLEDGIEALTLCPNPHDIET